MTRDCVIHMNPQELSLPLTTDRLILRAYRESDAEALLPIYSREDVARFLLCDPWTAEESRTEISKRIPKTGLDTESRALSLVIETKDGLDDIEGLSHHRRPRRSGSTANHQTRPRSAGSSILLPVVMASPLKRPLPCSISAFDHYGLNRVIAQMDARNTASAKLATRIGMQQEAHLRQDWWSKGEWTDTLIFGMLEQRPSGGVSLGAYGVRRRRVSEPTMMAPTIQHPMKRMRSQMYAASSLPVDTAVRASIAWESGNQSPIISSTSGS